MCVGNKPINNLVSELFKRALTCDSHIQTSVQRLYVHRPVSLLRLTLQLLLQCVEDLQPEVLRLFRQLKKVSP